MKKYISPEIEYFDFTLFDVMAISLQEGDKWDDGGGFAD